MKKRVLVTGASGFVGANLARRLIREGYETHLLVRQSYQSWRLKEIAAEVRLHQAELRDRDSLRTVMAAIKPEWVFHLAVYGGYSTQTGVDRMVETNLLGSIALLDVCAEVGVEAFVQTGSSSEYGCKAHPAAEGEMLEPNSHYAITKAAATHYCQFVAKQRNVHAVTVRLYSIYGPYEEPTRFVPTLIVRGLSRQIPPLVRRETARDFVYVDDAVEAMIEAAAHSDLPRGSVYNICTGQQSTVETVVSIVRRLLNVEEEPVWSTMPRRSWDTDVWVGSPEMAKRSFGWCARTGLEAGVERTIAWFHEKPERVEFYANRLKAASSG